MSNFTLFHNDFLKFFFSVCYKESIRRKGLKEPGYTRSLPLLFVIFLLVLLLLPTVDVVDEIKGLKIYLYIKKRRNTFLWPFSSYGLQKMPPVRLVCNFYLLVVFMQHFVQANIGVYSTTLSKLF